MSEDINKEIGKETETETETEIEIPIENQEPENQPQKTTSKEPQTKVKDISKLTLEERAKIISDARNGIPSEHYDVIVLKNGNTRIVKKKIKTPSLSNRLINEQKQEVNNSKKLYMSDNQLMMEHIIELNNQVNKLANKHKKLKKKYRVAQIDEICIKLTGWRQRSYPLEIYAGDELIWSGETERSLGYVHLQVKPIMAREITVRLKGSNVDKDAFGAIVELVEPVAGELDLFKAENGATSSI